MPQLRLAVKGLDDGAAARALALALAGAPGIRSAQTDVAAGQVAVALDDGAGATRAFTDALASAGCEAETEQRAFAVEGMHCANCVARVERALGAAPGVLDVQVNLALESAAVTGLAGALAATPLAERLAREGYGLRPLSAAEADLDRAKARLDAEGRRVAVSAALTAPMVASMIFQTFGFEDIHLMPAAEVLLATPIQFVLGARFYRSAWQALRARAANMDVLVALGTSAAYGYSWYLLLTLGAAADGALYFEACAVIITLVLLGKWLEGRAKRATTAAIRQLLALRPATARVRRGAAEREVPVGDVRVGDVALVYPGQRLPVDGVVLAGEGEVDESLLTGEAMPVLKRVGDAVTGGSVSASGRFEVRATAVGADTALAGIVRLVENAQRGKARVQRLVDRVSGVFVPAVLVLAALTFAAWQLVTGDFEAALIASVSVLVIACPCALGLASPTAIMAGTGAAARAGILVGDVDAFERAPGLTTVVFDKTGTLTLGRPELARVEVWTGTAGARAEHRRAVLRLAASVQQASEHPLARTVLRAAEDRGVDVAPVTSFVNHVGRGVSGVVDGRRVRVGNAELVPEAANVRLGSAGETVAWVADGHGLRGALLFSDGLRPSAEAAVARLRQLGIRPVVLSGDAPAAVRRVADALGIEDARGGVLPEHKADAVRALAERGERVAMVGDGVNDAPALAAAHVGIAVGGGTDIAMQTAGVTLMRPDPMLVAGTVAVAKATFRKIKQNLFWAFAYNMLALPAAAFGHLSPTLAGAAMACSSVCVVANSLLLRRWKPPAGAAPRSRGGFPAPPWRRHAGAGVA